MNSRHLGPRKCSHDVYIMGLCGNCGIKLDPPQQSSSVSMVHSLPGLRVSTEYARDLGREDQERLIRERKLVLLVDLDQTILHTTHEPFKNDPRVHSFQLWPGHPVYHTKLRPHLSEFLEKMSKLYELHIFTFGCRMYAHKIASIIDPDKKYFGNRILSRDESVDQYSKKGNLNNLFPCGDSMVCIIDDRADVWRDAGNLIQVKPYSYFNTSISDGAMTDLPTEDDESLDREVDKLNALLGLIDDAKDSDSKKPKKADEVSEEPETRPSKKVKFSEEESGEVKEETREEGGTENEDKGDNESEDKNEQGAAEVGTEGEKKEKIDDQPEEIIDPDDHLKEYLPNILRRIHEKWYKKLDEETQFLVDEEHYKLPDIKDIIKTYLRRRD